MTQADGNVPKAGLGASEVIDLRYTLEYPINHLSNVVYVTIHIYIHRYMKMHEMDRV